MPRYFFQLPAQATPDTEGVELPDLDAARRVAVHAACGMIAEGVEEFCQTGEWRMTVSDEDGLALFNLTFVASDGS
jgi:hypothetical protein